MDDESESESESDSEPEPAPPGEEMSPVETGKEKELLPPGVEAEAPSIDESLVPPGEYGQKSVYWHHLTVPYNYINPFAPGDFAGKRVLKLVEWFSGHCRAIKR